MIDERRAHPQADALVVLVVGLAEEDAPASAEAVLDDGPGAPQVPAERPPLRGVAAVVRGRRAPADLGVGARPRAVALALHPQLAGALVLDEHADVLGLREQLEQRVDQLLEQR